MITSSRHLLTLGAVDFTDPDGGIMFMAGDANSWGSPQSVVAIVESLIADGSLVKWQRDDNRTVAFNVDITGSDSGELAWREAALVAELYRPNQLTWVPPDAVAPPSVFTVLTSSMELKPLADGFDELLLRRTYTVTLTCAPYVSSADPTMVSSAIQGAGGATVLASGSSTTGWTAQEAMSTSLGSLYINSTTGTYAPPPAGGGTYGLTTWATWARLALGSSINFATTPQIYLDVITTQSFTYGGVFFYCSGPTPYLTVDGGSKITPFAQYVSPDNAGFTRFVFEFAGTATTSLRLDFVGTLRSNDPAAAGRPTDTHFKALGYAGRAPGLQTHETLFTAPIGGSRRAPASLHLYRAGAGSVGDAIVYTGPDLADGYVPALRRYAVGGTSDGTAWSGFNGWTTAPAVPVGLLSPGAYVAVIRAKAGSANAQAKFVWRATLGSRTVTSTIYGPIATSYGLTVLGGLVLPPIAVPGVSTQTVSIDNVGSDTMTVDDIYLLRLGEGSAITILKGANAHVWSNAPTFSDPTPGLFTGAAADGSDALSAQNVAGGWDIHLAEPGNLLTYVACAATDAQLDLTYTKQWHTHAAE